MKQALKALIERNKNNKHPEQKNDELFLSNWRFGIRFLPSINEIEWKTKRIGKIAYDCKGQRLPENYNLKPIFVKKAEVEEAIKQEE